METSTEGDAAATYKIVLIGDAGVGKSNILSQFISGQIADSKATLTVEFASKAIQVGGRKVIVQLWDTAGQERYRSITKAYYKDAVGALLVYDITKLSSFQNVGKWMQELHDHEECGMAVALAGNKCDLKLVRAVKTLEAAEFAKKKSFDSIYSRLGVDMIFVETSALEGTNVDVVFKLLVDGLRTCP